MTWYNFSQSAALGSIKSIGLSCLSTVILTSPFVTSAHASSGFFDPGIAVSGWGAAGVLTPVEEEFDGGEIALGSTGQVVTLFRNDGGRVIQIGDVKLYPSSTISAAVELNECKDVPLPPGAECPIVISVKGLQTGAWRVSMLVQNDGRSQITSAAVAGDVESSSTDNQNVLSDIEAIPNEIDFGSLSSSQPLIKSVVFRNVTATPLSVKNVRIAAASQSGYRLDHDCGDLNPSEACLATVTWAPQQSGQADAVIVVEHSGSSRIASIPLTGEFDPEESDIAEVFPSAVPGRGLMVSTQDEIDFESGIENESTISLSLVNVGDADLTIHDIDLSGTDNGLSILDRGCQEGAILRPIEACPLTLRWVPVREGAIFDDLQIVHNGARGVLVVPVRGEATRAVSKDSQAIVERGGVVEKNYRKLDALSGFSITSHSGQKAIIVGPGGSRIVKDKQSVVIGGVEWDVRITSAGIEFKNGSDKINLLFDRSLSTGSSSGGAATTTTTNTSDQ